MALTIAVIVCAYNEARHLPACLFLPSGPDPTDDILVINNASTDDTGAVARAVPGIRVLDEPANGLVMTRETAHRAVNSDVLAYMDADCRAPIQWLERIEGRFLRGESTVAVTGPYQFYDWNWSGRALIRVSSWKTLLRCEKSWEAVARALRANVDVALTLYRNGSWAV